MWGLTLKEKGIWDSKTHGSLSQDSGFLINTDSENNCLQPCSLPHLREGNF